MDSTLSMAHAVNVPSGQHPDMRRHRAISARRGTKILLPDHHAHLAVMATTQTRRDRQLALNVPSGHHLDMRRHLSLSARRGTKILLSDHHAHLAVMATIQTRRDRQLALNVPSGHHLGMRRHRAIRYRHHHQFRHQVLLQNRLS